MNTTTNTTANERWARRALPRIAHEYGIRNPRLQWRRSRTKGYASGHCWYRYPCAITVTEGNPGLANWCGIDHDVDARSVFLHEMAHAITQCGHDEEFYTVLWTLIRQHRLPVRECAKREAPRGAGRKAMLATGRRRTV